MAGYIGTQPVPQATQTRDAFTATSNQTSFPTSGYTPEFLDVFLNGVKLAAADYTATNGSDVVLAVGATTGDILEVVSYGTFEVLNPTFDGNVTFTGNASFGDNDKAKFGDGSELQIYSDGTHGIIKESGSGDLLIYGNNLRLGNADGSELYILGNNNAEVQLRHNNATKLATTSTGIDVTGKATLTSGELTFSGSISDPNGAAYIWRPADNTLAFGTANEERMRIDSSGNVLVGKTSDTFGTIGTAINQVGEVQITRASATPMYIRRNTNDGELIGFYKDGTAVGSIGVRDGTSLFIESTASNRTGLDLSGGVLPRYGTSLSDNQVDLGAGSYRFKDLYLSGGVYLGGTGSANKLDDYEEGTWTPTANFNSGGSATHTRQTGTYTKIGRFVFCDISIIFRKNTGSGTLQIINLPFSNTNGQDRGCASFGYFSGLNGIPIGLMDSNTNKIDIRTALNSTSYNDDANGNDSITDGDLDAETNFHFSITYKTN